MKALGLDLGTTSLSAVVLETDSGVLAAKTVQNAAFLPGERWERTQNAEEIYAAALPLVQELVCEHPEICAIGLCKTPEHLLLCHSRGFPERLAQVGVAGMSLPFAFA